MTLRFSGYAALFNLRDAGGDIILPGAFTRTLAARLEQKSADGGLLPLLWLHQPECRIGWIISATEDGVGLRVVAEIDAPMRGNFAAVNLKDGTVTGLSFGYRTRAATRDERGRTLREVDLFEVSLVAHPMQSGARVTAMEEV